MKMQNPPRRSRSVDDPTMPLVISTLPLPPDLPQWMQERRVSWDPCMVSKHCVLALLLRYYTTEGKLVNQS